VPQVLTGFGTPEQKAIERMSVAEARRYLEAGEFPAGSMGPKVESAIQFAETSGQEVLITDVESLREGLEGKAGTRVVP
jgi:carbamate kinase